MTFQGAFFHEPPNRLNPKNDADPVIADQATLIPMGVFSDGAVETGQHSDS